MSKQIPLTQGKFAIVDDEDYEELVQYRWHYTKAGYASRYGGGGRKNHISIYMHRQIMNPPPGFEVHHKNSNRLDNRKCNLQIATHKENLSHQIKPKGNFTSRYKGVKWIKTGKRRKRWVATIKVNYKDIHLGYFGSEVDAAKAYDEKARELFGEFAKTNF